MARGFTREPIRRRFLGIPSRPPRLRRIFLMRSPALFPRRGSRRSASPRVGLDFRRFFRRAKSLSPGVVAVLFSVEADAKIKSMSTRSLANPHFSPRPWPYLCETEKEMKREGERANEDAVETAGSTVSLDFFSLRSLAEISFRNGERDVIINTARWIRHACDSTRLFVPSVF